MKKVNYNKLVRDLVKNKIEAKGEACSVRTITDEVEFKEELLKKLLEEARELTEAASRDVFLQEYADLMVVLDALTGLMEVSEAELQVAMKENVEKKGFFKNRHFLEWSEDTDYKNNETPQEIK